MAVNGITNPTLSRCNAGLTSCNVPARPGRCNGNREFPTEPKGNFQERFIIPKAGAVYDGKVPVLQMKLVV